MKRKTNEQFLLELKGVNPNTIPLESYSRANEKILVECCVCGNQWKSTPNNLLHGRGCKKCATKDVHDLQRKGNEKFINELSVVDPTINVLDEYTGGDSKILVECKVCGNQWSPQAKSLLRGNGCPKCGLARRVIKQTKTNESFLEEIKNINPNIIVIGKYVNSNTKIKVKCVICGHEWEAFPNNLLRDHGCAECAKNTIAEKKACSPEEFSLKLQTINPNILQLETYSKGRNHLKVCCSICGYKWSPVAQSLLSGRGCPKCAQIIKANKLKRSHSSFVEDVIKINPKIEILGKYVSSEKSVRTKCSICGYEWEPKPSVLLSGGGCPKCAGNLKKSQEQVICEIEKVNPNIKVIGNYINAQTKLTVKCQICGNVWEALTGNLRRGEGCPACGHAPTSFAEQFLLSAFRILFGKDEVQSRDKKAIGKELDIYIPKYKTAIEIGSWFWHKKRLRNDKAKREDCEQKGIRLIIVYDCFNEKETPFDCDFYFYTRDLGSERGNKKLRELATILAQQMNKDISPLTSKDWEEITHDAYKNSRMVTTEEFRNRMSMINPNIEIVGEYTRARDKIKCHCLSCGNYWENTPYHLINGQGCPECAKLNGGKVRRKAVINLDTGELFDCAEDAARKYNCNPEFLKQCCRGTYETCKGFRWRYEDSI